MIRAILIWLMLALPAAAEPARLDTAASSVSLGEPQGWFGKNRPRPVTLDLAMTRGVPYRLFLLDGPPRLVVDFDGLDMGDGPLPGAEALPALRMGRMADGWSRLVAELPGPYRVETTGMAGKAPARLTIALAPVAANDFAPRAGADIALRDLPPTTELPPAATDGRLVVMLDPGHGGIDPGAQSGGASEADLVLGFAQDLARALTARGIEVMMTREGDYYVGLEDRVTAARTDRADLFISLHADALPVGEAAGATVYVWNSEADDHATAQLAQTHDRDDLLAGLDLGNADDMLAATLMDIARTDTQPRSVNFAKFLASGMALSDIGLHRRPVKGARFAVLKSPDIPAVLVELGFITDARDRANLTDPAWRARMVGVIAQAVMGWAEDDTARRAQLRR